MTVLAGVAAENVTSVFSGGNNAVVARAAAAEHLRVIDAGHRRERDDRMAVLTDVCRQCMRRRLADRCDVVVAIDTLTRDVVVIEVRRRPARGRVAVVAGIAARDVCRMFPDCGYTVVARAARPEHLRVIDLCDGRERRRRMAILAEARRRNVREMFTRRADAVMTAYAVGRNPEVVEEDRKPRSRQVACIAFLLRRRVVGRLAHALNIVVARRAATEDGVVVHLGKRKPGRLAMAVFAEIGGQDMVGRFCGNADTAANRVAADAIDGRALKDAAEMAGLAIGSNVRAFELKARREVIEVRRESGLGGTERRHEQQHGDPVSEPMHYLSSVKASVVWQRPQSMPKPVA